MYLIILYIPCADNYMFSKFNIINQYNKDSYIFIFFFGSIAQNSYRSSE